MNELNKQLDNFYIKISELLKSARKTVIQSVNNTMVITYFEIGKLILMKNNMVKKKQSTVKT